MFYTRHDNLKRDVNGFVADKIPLFYTKNLRIGLFHGEEWLIADIFCAREDLAHELQYLTKYRTKQIVEYLQLKLSPHHVCTEPVVWPNYWGVSGMGMDILPIGDGDADLTSNGLYIKKLNITNFTTWCASPFGTPICVDKIWQGKHSVQLCYDHTGKLYAVDTIQNEWNPLRQAPKEYLDRFGIKL